MKAQRRHDLADNTLARGIVKIPTFLEQYGNKILTVILVLALMAVIIRYRVNASRESFARAADALNIARSSIEDLRDRSFIPGSETATATARSQLITDARTAIETISSETDDRHLLAEASLARGDLYWQIANLPVLSGAATQPFLRPGAEPTEALRTAESAYNKLIETYPEEKLAITSARFGLAAIAENRGQWEMARQHYQSIANDPAVSRSFQDQARLRLDLLTRVQRPVYLAPATQATTAPA